MHSRMNSMNRMVHFGAVVPLTIDPSMILSKPELQTVATPSPYTHQEIPDGDENMGPPPVGLHPKSTEPAEGRAKRLLLDAFVHLTDLRSKVPAVGTKLDSLIEKVSAALLEVDAELVAQQCFLADLEQRHEAVLAKGQKQLRIVLAAKQKTDQLYVVAENTISVETSARRELKNISDTPLGRWATRADMAALEKKIAASKAVLHEAVQASRSAVADFNAAKAELEEAQVAYRTLDLEERKLRQAIAGDLTAFDPETGLAHAPGSYVAQPE